MKTHMRKGFTLIELLIVVVIIGILAAIAIPKFANTKDKAYFATIKTDLRNLATAEEGYFADNQTYSTSLSAVNDAPSKNVTITITSTGITKGWSAVGVNSAISGTANSCQIHVGGDVGAGQLDGVVSCP